MDKHIECDFWLSLFKKRERMEENRLLLTTVKTQMCVQASSRLKRLRSRAVPRALHAAKSTVNAWGAGKSVSRLERGRRSSFRPL